MKHLKSSLKDLQDIIERDFIIHYIAETICSFDESANTQDVLEFMKQKDFDAIGIRSNGLVNGYALQSEIETAENGKKLGDYKKTCKPTLSIFASIKEAFNLLETVDRIFVTCFSTEIVGIITKGDLQKIPVRMWLFSIVSILEMQLLRVIRKEFPSDEGWKALLDVKRYDKAVKEFHKRKQQNAAIDLADCLEFCDKREIISKSESILYKLKQSKNKFNGNLISLENRVRNLLAHSQDIITDNWPKMAKLIKYAESLIDRCEKI